MKIIRLFVLLATPVLCQNLPTPLQVTRYSAITASTTLDCGSGRPVIDNRSEALRQNDNHSFYAAGGGSWSVDMQYSDSGTCTGPWVSFGSAVTQASSSGIGFGFGYHAFISFSISGSVSVNYSGWKRMYLPSGNGGSALFPIQVPQGGTGATGTIGAKVNLNLPSYYSKDYNFAAQSPGGSLIAGGSGQAISMTPCPTGVNGSDTSHYLRITGGVGSTGTDEVVAITGGTCTSDASSGTITVTPANNHSGAWQVSSATAGIQEAVNVAGAAGGGMVVVLSGQSDVYAAITYTSNLVEIVGQGKNSVLMAHQAAGDIIYLHAGGLGFGTGYRNAVRNLAIQSPAIGSALTGIHVDGQVELDIDSVLISYVKNGVQIDGTTTTSIVRIDNCAIEILTPTTGVGVLQNGGADIFVKNTAILGAYGSQPRAGIEITYSTGTKLIDNEVFATGLGLLIDPGNGQVALAVDSVTNWYDSSLLGDAVKIAPTGSGVVKQVKFVGDWMTSASGSGLHFAATAIDGVNVSQTQIYNNGQYGILYEGGSHVDIIGASVSGNSVSSPGTYHGFATAPNAGGFHILGGTYGPSGAWADQQGYGILISSGAADNYSVTGANVTGNTVGTMGDGGTGLHKIVKDNPGASTAMGALASGASVTLIPFPQEAFAVTGTVTTTTIAGGWIGRRIRLYKTDSGSVTIGGGGNIPGSHTLSQNGGLDLVFDGTNWY